MATALASVTRKSERDDRAEQWQRILHEGGWAGMTWPERFGGRGLTPVHEAIFLQEAALRNAPTPANLLGMILAGPTIMVHGTEQQQERFLPPILSGEEIWCQGFSEPGSGSDLASLASRATPTEDGYVVTRRGDKVAYGEISELARSFTNVPAAAPKNMSDWKIIGKPYPREDARRIVTGTMPYALDTPVEGALPTVIALADTHGAGGSLSERLSHTFRSTTTHDKLEALGVVQHEDASGEGTRAHAAHGPAWPIPTQTRYGGSCLSRPSATLRAKI